MTWVCFGLIGITLPANPPVSRFFMTVWPTLPTLSDAPITAIVRGVRIEDRSWRSSDADQWASCRGVGDCVLEDIRRLGMSNRRVLAFQRRYRGQSTSELWPVSET